MDKNKAMKRLDAIEAEAKELRRIIEGPQVDPSEWVGKWGFYSDESSLCPNDGNLRFLKDYIEGKEHPFEVSNGTHWRYFRPATAEELGFAPEIKPDWSKAPEWAKWWARAQYGDTFWFENKPTIGAGCFLPNGGMFASAAISGWEDSPTKRPE